LAAFSLTLGDAAAADTRTVTVNVSVIDDKDRNIAKATVVVTPEDGAPVTAMTDEQGNAAAVVGIPAARLGEGWLRAAPKLTVIATKDSISARQTLTVQPKLFQGGNSATLPCTVVLKTPLPPVTVQLKVSVEDEAPNPVSGARVNVSAMDDKDQDIAGVIVTPVAAITDAQGNAAVTVAIPAVWFGAGRAAPKLTVIATKDSASSRKTLPLQSKDFQGGNSATLPCPIVLKAPPPPVNVQLKVSVKDEAGDAVSGARVNVHQSDLARFRGSIPTPPTAQEYTNAQGIAYLTVTAKSGEPLDLGIEVAREDMESQKQTLSLAPPLPAQRPVDIVLRKKSSAGAGPTISVTMEVQDSQGKPLEGAAVLIRDSSLGAVTGRFTGVTGADGKTTIPVMYGSADKQENLPTEATKTGYKKGGISIALAEKQVGKTVFGGTIKLEQAVAGGTRLTVTVKDKDTKQGVGDAEVILDGAGYYSDRTNASGVTTFDVSETGTFAVRISQEHYRPATGEIRILKNEPETIPPPFELELKAKKDEGNDKIEVTVLKRDPTDEKSKPSPLAGAQVRAGSISNSTDENGRVTLTGAFAEKTEVSVAANGYKPQQRTIGINKLTAFSAGTGSETFTLDPELSDESPIRFVVDVRDPEGAKIPNADVDFYSVKGDLLFGKSTGSKAEKVVDFRNSDSPNVPLADLRKGITINVKAPGYLPVLNRSVPSNLVQPSLSAGTYEVALERDWSALEQAIAALEGQVQAWRQDLDMSAPTELEKKAGSLVESADRLEEEITAAAASFGITMGSGPAVERCRKGKELQDAIRLAEGEANQRAQELERLLNAAAETVKICSGATDPATIRANYQDAIKLLAEIGTRNKQAVRARDELMKLSAQSIEMMRRLKELEAKLLTFDSLAKDAEQNANAARERFEQQTKKRTELAGRHAALQAEVRKLQTTFNPEKKTIPAKLNARIDALISKLDLSSFVTAAGTPKKPSEKLMAAAESIRTTRQKAEKTLEIYRQAACDLDTMASTVDGIDTTLRNATFEVGLAANLPADAAACEKKLAAATADTITVPDVTVYNDVGQAVQAARQAGMTPSIAAARPDAAKNMARMIVGQRPLPNETAKRGDPLIIYLNQALAEKKASTPTPSPSPVATASPSPTASEALVTVPAIFTGNTAEIAKSALSSVGLIAAFNAKGGRPPTKEQEFKTTGALEPVAGTKVPRGSTVTVSLYQKYEETAQTTPTASPQGPGSGSSAMPNLIGLTLDEAVAKLPAGMRIGSTEVGRKPKSPEKELTIFAQSPDAGTKTDRSKEVVVSVKLFGSRETTSDSSGSNPSSDPFTGVWAGKWPDDKSNPTELTISKDPERAGSYLILMQGHTYPYPASSDGTQLSHQHGIHELTYRRVGDTLECKYRYQPLRGGPVTGQTILRKK